jgi:hypothetical protein
MKEGDRGKGMKFLKPSYKGTDPIHEGKNVMAL